MKQKLHFEHTLAYLLFLIGLVAMFLWSTGTIWASEIKRNDHFIQSRIDPTSKIYIREKQLASPDSTQKRRVILFVHGRTAPTALVDVPGYSMLDWFAMAGYIVFSLDLRGYGQSTRPPWMNEPPEKGPPSLGTVEDAVSDITDAVDFIQKRTQVAKLSLIGYSWGTLRGARFTSLYNEKVSKLVLYGAVHKFTGNPILRQVLDPADPTKLNPRIGAYSIGTIPDMVNIWNRMITSTNKQEWREDSAVEAAGRALLDSDPDLNRQGPKGFRAPEGTMLDVFRVATGGILYEGKKISVPTLVIRGSADILSIQSDAMEIYTELGSTTKRYIEIGRSTHFIHLERAAEQLFREILLFLNE